MRFEKFGLDDRGITLVNLVVGLGIGAIVTLGMAAAVSMTFTAQKNTDVKTTASLFTDELARVAAGTLSCNKAFGTAAGATALSATPTEITLQSIGGGSTVAAGYRISPSVEIAELKLRENTAIPTVPAAGGAGYVRKAAILSVRMRSLADPNIPLRARDIPLRVVTDAGGVIRNCSVENSEAQVCEAVGGVWDPTSLEAQKCKPKGYCQYGGSYSEAPLGGYANPVTGLMGCNDGFTPQVSGSIPNTVVVSKSNFRTDHYPVYTCLRCADPLNGTVLGVNSTFMDFTQALNDALAAGSNTNTLLLNGFGVFSGFNILP